MGFNPEGNEMHIKPIELYAGPNDQLNFWELLARGRTRCEVVIGFYSAYHGNELIINPTLTNTAESSGGPIGRAIQFHGRKGIVLWSSVRTRHKQGSIRGSI